jgi:hypothetical protein
MTRELVEDTEQMDPLKQHTAREYHAVASTRMKAAERPVTLSILRDLLV